VYRALQISEWNWLEIGAMNGFLRLIESDGSVLGSFLSEIAAPNLLRIMKSGGLQFVVIDCEHGCFDYSQVSAIAAVGNGIGFPVIVRIPSITREPVQKYLDAGADGLLAPMTDTVEQAKALAAYGKYAPTGARGISTTRPHSEYNPGKLSDYMQKANDRVMLFVQIETEQAVKAAFDIASVEGIDGLIVGPNDLASSFGQAGNLTSPRMWEAIQTVIAAASKNGKPSGIVASDMAFLKKCRTAGMSIFSCNSEVGLLRQQIKTVVGSFV
jgi:2-keto-3-deoxy-L-rhamnonate aldolase RhmA